MSPRWLEPDFLRRRRDHIGLPAPRRVPARPLLIKGIIIGTASTSITISLYIIILILLGSVEQQLLALQPKIREYNQNIQKINSTKLLILEVAKKTTSLAKSISGVRSGSAIISEIINFFPRDSQLTSLIIESDSLILNATSDSHLGLFSANALMLSLDKSPFFQSSSARLNEASSTSNSEQSLSSRVEGLRPLFSSNSRDIINYKISTTLSSGQFLGDILQLQKLGSLGLARRIQILKAEGLVE